MPTAIELTETDRTRIATAVDALQAIARDVTTHEVVADVDVARARWVATDALTACLIGEDLLGPGHTTGDLPWEVIRDDLPRIFGGLLELDSRQHLGFASCEFIARCGDVLRGVTRLGIGA